MAQSDSVIAVSSVAAIETELPEEFDAKEKEGIIWFKWKIAEMEGLILPISRTKESDTGVKLAVSPASVELAADKIKKWLGESAAIIYQSGEANPYHIWERKRELEQNLRVSGIAVNISTITTQSGTIFASGQSTCPRCGKTVIPNAPHECTWASGAVTPM